MKYPFEKHVAGLFGIILLASALSGCVPRDLAPEDQDHFRAEHGGEETERRPERVERTVISGVPFLSGIVLIKVGTGDDDEFDPVFDAEIEIRNERRELIEKGKSNVRGEFLIASPMLREGDQYLMIVRTEDKRASFEFVYNYEDAENFELTVSDIITLNISDQRFTGDRPIRGQVRPDN